MHAGSWGLLDVRVVRGGRVTLDDVSLELQAGTITAVVGGDGAGKSTLLQVVTGLVTAASGTVVRPSAQRLGSTGESGGVWHDLTVHEHVRFVADAFGLNRRTSDDRARMLLHRADLDDAGDRLAGHLSGGMRQKLAVLLAMLHQPDVLVLDEPTTGVDPTSRAELWRLVGHAAAEGAAVLLSTTYLDEAERASAVLVLDEGRTLLQGDPVELVTEAGAGSLEALVMRLQRDREVA
jgi:ABC-2 type transport system ATP-binding protein